MGDECRLEGCSVLSGGSCLEGHGEFRKCPNFVGDAPAVRVGHSGSALSPDEIKTMLRSRRTELIALCGDFSVGKTTLVATLYQQFLEPTPKRFVFVDSNTLVGLEERCHYARLACGGNRADTKRTSSLVQEGLHLKLAPAANAGLAADLIFLDCSGERWRRLLEGREDGSNFDPVFAAAGQVVAAIDGPACLSLEERVTRPRNLRSTVELACQEGIFAPDVEIHVVVTKMDQIDKGSPDWLAFEHELDRQLKLMRAHGRKVHLHHVQCVDTLSGETRDSMMAFLAGVVPQSGQEYPAPELWQASGGAS